MMKRLISLAIAGAMSWAMISAAPAAQGSGCMPTTGTVSGLSFSQLINQALAALISGNSGASAPITDCSVAPVKGQTWLDTSVTPNVEKRYDGTNWITVGAMDASNHLWVPPVGGGMASVTANTTTDICAAPAAVQSISGTTAISSFGSSCVVGARKTLIFNSATPITYSGTSLIIPGAASYTASPGDVAEAIYLGAANWRVLSISRSDGSAVVNPSVPIGTVLYGDWGTIPAKTVYGYGQAISRAANPGYLAAVTRTQSGTITAGSNQITGLANTAGLGVGMNVEGTGVPPGATISVVGANTIVMSGNASGNGLQSITVFLQGYGAGGDSTTVGVRDCRGRTMAGRDNMGGTPASRLTANFFGVSADRIGATGGFEYHYLTTPEMPSHSHADTATVNDPGHAHSPSDASAWFVTFKPGTGPNSVVAGGSVQTNVATTNVSTTNISVTMNNALTGGGAPHSIVAPTGIAECVVVVQP